MIFKKLEMTGFKSFLEKTVLSFEPGVTTIVGPNGCGKSNIVDAIKWVLGEQSVKSLRGSKMEDVIFNGTDEKEPINMAEVSLTLSNKNKILPIDSDEVVVSRRIFRSGESEYILNKAPVRLKDVNDLFMGTGIGAEAYSLIEQGKIDLIISSRPEDRRFIFEEASGITKYKSRKREAIRKLEATENNVLRVNDIINEVKRQIDSITRQAKKAERYKERFDKLKELEIKLASFEYDLLRKERDEMGAQSAKIKDKMRSLSSEIAALRDDAQGRKATLAEIDRKYSDLQNGKFSRESLIEQDRNKIEVNRERTSELSGRILDLEKEIENLGAQRDSAAGILQELEARLQTVQDSEGTKKEFLRENEKNLERIESEIKFNDNRIEESKEKMVDYMAERSKSRNEVIRLSSDIQNRSARVRRLDLELEKVKSERAAVSERLEEAKREFKDVEAKVINIRSERDGLKKDREAVASSLKSLGEGLQAERNKLIALESKKTFLEDLIVRQEGFQAGVKALLETIKREELRIDGIRGVLGKVIKVKRGCELPVEAALGDYVQCVVSSNRESALRALEYLESNKKGRATFIILDELANSAEDSAETAPPAGVLGKLGDFVSADRELEGAIRTLLKDAYLIEDIKDSEKILTALSGNLGKDIKLVTKRGEIVRRGFITAGVSPKGEEAGIIGREERLKETVRDIELAKNEIDKIESETDGFESRLEDYNERLNGAEEFLKREEREYHKKETKLTSVEEENARLEEEMSLLKMERDEVGEELKELASRKEELEKRLKELEAWENETQNVLLNSQGAVKNLAKEREDALVVIAKINTEVQAVSKEKASLSQSLNLHRESYKTYVNSLEQKAKEIELSGRKKEEFEQEAEEMESEIVKLAEELKGVNEELIEVEKVKSESASLVGDIEKRLNELYQLSNEDKDAEHKLEMQKSELGYKIETLKNRMSQLYKADMDADKFEIGPSPDWDAIRREIELLSRKLESMGTVNLVAIEEHKELEERFNFLTQQRDDLIKAKDDLQKAIAKINKTTRKLFMETFEKIQFEFKNYFRYLFGGGQAEVFLLDEHDVLESGIEIVARPPGKKLQSITLLSGGEKSMTAIALVFAIFKVKPSPFCLLDEVDAALDESNVERFGKAVLDFTKKSQFIVVTHNKRTISIADVMYGITMEKSGISKIVSVKFHEKSKEKGVVAEDKEREEKEEVLA